MRTTLHVDDEAYTIAVRHAKLRKIRLGRAISDLIIRGAKAEIPVRQENGLTVFDPPAHLPKLTTEQVKRLAEE